MYFGLHYLTLLGLTFHDIHILASLILHDVKYISRENYSSWQGT